MSLNRDITIDPNRISALTGGAVPTVGTGSHL